jgi:hypothetical protein
MGQAGVLLLARRLTAAVKLSAIANPLVASAVDTNSGVDAYYGVGCFWHVQHEMVKFEQDALGRSDSEITV